MASYKVLIAQGANQTNNVFDEMGIYWVEIADAHQTQRQIDFLKRHLKMEGCVLDDACGSGRHTIALAELGFDMVGLDVSVKLLRVAKHRCRHIELVRGDMRFLPFKVAAFSSAISMDTSIGYLPSENDDVASLVEIRRVLRLKSKLVIDVFNRVNLTAKGPSVTHKAYPSFLLNQKQTVSKTGDRRFDRWEVRDKQSGQTMVFEHSVRLYQREQIERLLKDTGFSVEKIFGGYEDQQFSAGTPQLILTVFAC